MSCRTTIIVLLLLTLFGISGVKGHRNEFQLPVPQALGETGLSAWDVYLPTLANGTCQKSLDFLEDELWEDGNTGAHKLVDSWGSTATSFIIGIPYFYGTFDACQQSRYHDDQFHGLYCRISVEKQPQKNGAPAKHYLQAPFEVQGTILDVLDGQLENYTEITYGTCIPDACSKDELEVSLNETFTPTEFLVKSVKCGFDYRYDSFSAGDIAFIALLSLFAFLLLSASIVDIYIQKTGKKELAKGPLQYLLPFSAYTNIEKLFHINTVKTPGMITCLHGIRVLSMTWVVCAHQASVTFIYSSNLWTMFDKMQGLLYQTLLDGFPSVDTFFFMSGFLMSYNVLKEFKRSKKFNLFLFYFHRLLRLIPPICLVCGLYATIPVFFMNGPNANIWKYYWRPMCQDGWYKDALFYDNFAAKNQEPICLGQAWYLGVDSQLYLFAPLVLYPLLYMRQIGMVWLYLLTVISMVVPGVITYINDLPPSSLLLDPKGTEYFYDIYMMPWCRAGPVLIGMWLGIFLHDQGNTRIKMKPWQVLTGWTVAISSALMMVYGIWSYNVVPRKAQYDVMTATLYGATNRHVWAAAVSWVVFACYNGYGGFVNDFLSHPIWQPMSRLTYSMYLVAMPLQYIITYNAKTPYYFSHYTKVLETVGALILAVIPSVLVSLTVESPIIGIEKIIFRRPNRGDDTRKKEVNGVDNKAFEDMKELDRVDVIGKEVEEKEVLTTNL